MPLVQGMMEGSQSLTVESTHSIMKYLYQALHGVLVLRDYMERDMFIQGGFTRVGMVFEQLERSLMKLTSELMDWREVLQQQEPAQSFKGVRLQLMAKRAHEFLRQVCYGLNIIDSITIT